MLDRDHNYWMLKEDRCQPRDVENYVLNFLVKVVNMYVIIKDKGHLSAGVSQPAISYGGLSRRGRTISIGEYNKPKLVHLKRGAWIPIDFKNGSLTVKGWIRRVSYVRHVPADVPQLRTRTSSSWTTAGRGFPIKSSPDQKVDWCHSWRLCGGMALSNYVGFGWQRLEHDWVLWRPAEAWQQRRHSRGGRDFWRSWCWRQFLQSRSVSWWVTGFRMLRQQVLLRFWCARCRFMWCSTRRCRRRRGCAYGWSSKSWSSSIVSMVPELPLRQELADEELPEDWLDGPDLDQGVQERWLHSNWLRVHHAGNEAYEAVAEDQRCWTWMNSSGQHTRTTGFVPARGWRWPNPRTRQFMTLSMSRRLHQNPQGQEAMEKVKKMEMKLEQVMEEFIYQPKKRWIWRVWVNTLVLLSFGAGGVENDVEGVHGRMMVVYREMLEGAGEAEIRGEHEHAEWLRQQAETLQW